ncbi:type II toxin-antitoxin system VapC family toxin [Rhizobium sp. RAF56]|jgi:ribonuclease VapC|uniref:type II toxin-antitoxin system VapC family toxin n=1 Tax=Rhizobium sp. RAF56 TaxID=3233062 RepID=UPI003F9AB99A
MFVDHSVIAAMMSDEEAARVFARRLQTASSRMTSPIEAARAAIAVSQTLSLPIADTDAAVRAFLQVVNIQCLAVPPRAATLACEAYARRAGEEGVAALDLNDCMTYACARYYRQPLLSASDRFRGMDVALV